MDRGWFMFFVTLLNQMYWVCGTSLGALFGSFLHFNTEGIDFAMTALFVVMFLNQWQQKENRRPAMILILACFYLEYRRKQSSEISPDPVSMLEAAQPQLMEEEE